MLRKINTIASVLVLLMFLEACGPRAHIPPRPVSLAGVIDSTDPRAALARALAPMLFVQHDEFFPLERVVAVIHPARRIIAYHLLWRDDAHGSWIPFTVPTDQEIVWVGFDSTSAPNELWTFWHGTLLHTPWPQRAVAINVQWGKHGSMPRGLMESDLPSPKKLNDFYLMHFLGIWDLWLGKLTRPGPGCFCHGYGRYREYDRPLPVADRIDAIVVTDDPREVLVRVFGRSYSKKKPWPPQ